ncbi:hypothetical protein Smic_75120 [Streptomyces microflavus]|uniref:Uncharacterized protein n=1 Tax=Streptomyces microflavus TaxID=1919 RepID=A0A7J0D2G4_STRMI|nr:hypothetical protein Smic_75120 [Streptomyces microflavus]
MRWSRPQRRKCSTTRGCGHRAGPHQGRGAGAVDDGDPDSPGGQFGGGGEADRARADDEDVDGGRGSADGEADGVDVAPARRGE